MNKQLLGGVLGGAAAALLVIGGTTWAGTLIAPAPTDTPASVVSVYELKGFTEGPIRPTPTPEPAAPVADAPAAPTGPTLCPEGTTANAVDAAGNESNCIENGPDDTQCVEFDANNNCTRYYKP